MNHTIKEINYEAFFYFSVDETEKDPTITVAKVLQKFQAQQNTQVTEMEKTRANWTKKQFDDYITNSIRAETLGRY